MKNNFKNNKSIFLLKLTIVFSVIAICFNSCMRDDELWDNNLEIFKPTKGVFIANEGNFMYDNASLSYYDIETKEVINDVFFSVNNVPLGDVAQSINVKDSLAYVVVNNSGKIYVIDVNTFKLKAKITGFTSPRYIHFVDDKKAYVTDLYAKSIAIVDVPNNEIIGHIDVNNNSSVHYQHPTEQMAQLGKYLYVNCWSYDNKILVIDTDTDVVIDSVEVPIQPTSLVIDKNKKLWTVTDGGFYGSPYGYEEPALVKIDALSLEIEKTYRFTKGIPASEITINSTLDTIYFLCKDVYRLDVNSTKEPELFIKSPYEQGGFFGGFYGLGVDPYSSEIYVADAIDYVQHGVVYRYTPKGELVDQFKVGIIPGAFGFK